MERSSGHLLWQERLDGTLREYFARNGEVYAAPSDSPVMPDGFRCGRWEIALARWESWQRVYNIEAVAA